MAVPQAMPRLGARRPHEWGLIFGSPVPGYRAPEETIAPYARLAVALLRPVADAYRYGRLTVEVSDRGSNWSAAHTAALDTALAPVHDILVSDAPTSVLLHTLQAWSTIVGAISLELFGHWRNAVLDPELFFTETIVALADQIGLPREFITTPDGPTQNLHQGLQFIDGRTRRARPVVDPGSPWLVSPSAVPLEVAATSLTRRSVGWA